jgi:two-component system sensor histidine kinase ChvG
LSAGPRPSPPIALRLLTLNLLVLFLPVAGVWSLRAFEEQLLKQEERAMVAQGRALAAGLDLDSAARPAEPVEGPPAGPRERARERLRALERPLEGRVRVYARDGSLLADTASGLAPLAARSSAGAAGASRIEENEARPSRRSWLYRLGRRAWRFVATWIGEERNDEAAYSSAVEPGVPRTALRAALAGGFGAQTQLSADGGILVLSIAVPIRSPAAEGVVGAVVVSRTTLTILRALDEVRVQLFGLLLVSLGVAAVLSFWFARGLALPLRALARESATGLDPSGNLRTTFTGHDRGDEIGALARGLGRLSASLARRLQDLEAFAADAAHEIKNPLATVRSAVELLPGEAEPEARIRLHQLALGEVGRIERLLTALRVLARLQSEDVDRMAFDGAEAVRERCDLCARERGVAVRIALAEALPPLRGSLERFEQVLDNLLSNAADFSVSALPAEGIEVALERVDGVRLVRLEVRDRGPGIPPEHLERVFDRFFSYRPNVAAGEHLGLGLGIVRAIVERNGGRVSAHPRDGGGAVLRVFWPTAERGAPQ